jgi:hypothetical protein
MGKNKEDIPFSGLSLAQIVPGTFWIHVTRNFAVLELYAAAESNILRDLNVLVN